MTPEQAKALAAIVCRTIDYFHASQVATESIGSSENAALADYCQACEAELVSAILEMPEDPR